MEQIYYIIMKSDFGNWVATCFEDNRFCYEKDEGSILNDAIKFYDIKSAEKIAKNDPLAKVAKITLNNKPGDCVDCNEKDKSVIIEKNITAIHQALAQTIEMAEQENYDSNSLKNWKEAIKLL